MATSAQASVEPRTRGAGLPGDTPAATGCKVLQPPVQVPPEGGEGIPQWGAPAGDAQTSAHTLAASRPAPNANHHRTIAAKHLQLALLAIKLRPGTRWAAMSNGAATSSCRRRQAGGGYLIHTPPLLAPMDRGHLGAVLDRVRAHGRAEVLRTWRCSIAVMQAEAATCVMRTVRGGR